MSNYNLLFSFVSHGSTRALERALSSLLQSVHSNSENSNLTISIFIIENKSLLHFHQLLLLKNAYSTSFPDFVVKYVDNNGYLDGLNKSLAFASSRKYSCLVVGNPDVVFAKDYISLLLSYLSSSSFSVGVPSVIDHSGNHQNPRYVNRYPSSKLFLQDFYFSSYYLFRLFHVLRHVVFLFRRCFPLFSSKEPLAINLSPMVLPVGVQFIFNLIEITSSVQFPRDIFLWGEEVIISRYCIDHISPIVYLKHLSVSHCNSHSTSLIPARQKYIIQKQSYFIYRNLLERLVLP